MGYKNINSILDGLHEISEAVSVKKVNYMSYKVNNGEHTIWYVEPVREYNKIKKFTRVTVLDVENVKNEKHRYELYKKANNFNGNLKEYYPEYPDRVLRMFLSDDRFGCIVSPKNYHLVSDYLREVEGKKKEVVVYEDELRDIITEIRHLSTLKYAVNVPVIASGPSLSGIYYILSSRGISPTIYKYAQRKGQNVVDELEKEYKEEMDYARNVFIRYLFNKY